MNQQNRNNRKVLIKNGEKNVGAQDSINVFNWIIHCTSELNMNNIYLAVFLFCGHSNYTQSRCLLRSNISRVLVKHLFLLVMTMVRVDNYIKPGCKDHLMLTVKVTIVDKWALYRDFINMIKKQLR